jgi:hypothetical protein
MAFHLNCAHTHTRTHARTEREREKKIAKVLRNWILSLVIHSLSHLLPCAGNRWVYSNWNFFKMWNGNPIIQIWSSKLARQNGINWHEINLNQTAHVYTLTTHRYKYSGDEKNLFSLLGFEPRIVQSTVFIYWFRYFRVAAEKVTANLSLQKQAFITDSSGNKEMIS